MSTSENNFHTINILTKSGKLTILRQFIWAIISAVVFFLSAGTLDISRAWIYYGIVLIYSVISGIIYWKLIPELANRRAGDLSGQKKWDQKLIKIYFLYMLFVLPMLLGLDVSRYNWSLLSSEFVIVGIFLYCISSIMIEWCLLINRHFEAIVRIQSDQNHQVIKSGPYSIIRHPGYLSMVVGGLAGSLIIGSLIGLIAYLIPVALLLIRTYYEDKTLQEELNGYKEYTQKVKYRLIPFIW